MRKHISVLLVCFLVAMVVMPGAYSAWQKNLNIVGLVQITKEKSHRSEARIKQVEPQKVEESSSFIEAETAEITDDENTKGVGENVTEELFADGIEMGNVELEE